MKSTKPEVFIIESLTFEDERNNRQEGKIISNILELNGKQSEYFYIRTKAELLEVVDIFYDSDYRYLHLSCHGNRNCMATTLDQISFEELGEILRPCIHERRLFFSACELANPELAQAVLPGSECYSIIGPSQAVRFSDAAILWASFYHLVFQHDPETMKRDSLLKYCRNIATLFNVPLSYYSKNRQSKNGIKLTEITP